MSGAVYGLPPPIDMEGMTMKTIQIAGKEYTLEYAFEAAEYKSVVQKMFNALSGGYIFKHAQIGENGEQNNSAEAMIDGTAELVSEIPHICKDAFYAGLLEHNPVSMEEAVNLMKIYMKENKLSFNKLYREIQTIMEDDGFFDLTGITEMLEEMNKTIEGETEETPKKTPKVPQDHKKKSTSTK